MRAVQYYYNLLYNLNGCVLGMINRVLHRVIYLLLTFDCSIYFLKLLFPFKGLVALVCILLGQQYS